MTLYALRDDTCVLHLPMNEGEGSVVYDHSRYGNNGQIIGANWTTGKFGNALSFDGVDDYVRVPNPEEIRFPANSPFTIAVWYNSVDSYSNGTGSPQYILFKKGAGYFSIAALSSGKSAFEWNTIVEEGSLITDGKWHFIVGVRKEDGEGLLYTDGELVASGEFDNREVANAATDLYIGQRDDGAYRTAGLIDEVRIYNRALSEEEIKSLYLYYQNFEVRPCILCPRPTI